MNIGADLYPLPGGKLDGNNSIGGQISLGSLAAATSGIVPMKPVARRSGKSTNNTRLSSSISFALTQANASKGPRSLPISACAKR
ncbi:MAG: hypothetical protein U0936_14785 [Planctomycetaceae bacterium]